jgi:hypothetical protein
MTQVEVSDGRLKIEILGWHKLWSFKSRFDLPLEHVVGITRFEKGWWQGGLRCPGTFIPRVIRAGSYYQSKKWYFWDVCKMNNAVVIELRNERYASLIVETPDPKNTIALIRSGIDRQR